MRFKGVKRIFALLLCTAFILGGDCVIRAADTSDSPIMHLTSSMSGIFEGKKLEYYFSFPGAWNGVVYVEWIGLDDDSKNVLERLNFYCKPKSTGYSPALMFSMYIYERKNWRDDFPLEVVIKNSLYVIAVDYKYARGFMDGTEQKRFRSVWDLANAPEKIKNMIELVGTTENISIRNVYINNVAIDLPPLHIDGIYYVPLRAVAEALDFTVQWRDYDKTVTLSKQSSIYDSFQIKSGMTADRRGIKMRLISDRTYVQTAYLFQILRKSADIDDDGNIYIYK